MSTKENFAKKFSLLPSNTSLYHQNFQEKKDSSNNDEKMSCSTLKNQLEFSMASSNQELIDDSMSDYINAIPGHLEEFSKNDNSLSDSCKIQKKFILNQNISFSKPLNSEDEIFVNNQQLKHKLLRALSSLLILKQEFNDLKNQVRIENERNSEILQAFSKKYLNVQQQPKLEDSDTFKIAYKNLTEINKQLLSRVMSVQHFNDTLQKEHKAELQKKQKQIMQILNDFHQTKIKNNNLNFELKRQKEENSRLHEQLFYLRQKQESIQLEVENRVKKYLNSYTKNAEFVNKTKKLKNSLKTFQDELDKSSSKVSPNGSSKNSEYLSHDFFEGQKNMIKISSPANSDEKMGHLSQVMVASTKSSFLSPSSAASDILFPHSTRINKGKNQTLREKKYQLNASLGAIDGRLKQMKSEINKDIQNLKGKYK